MSSLLPYISHSHADANSTGRNLIQDKINDYNEQTKRVDANGNAYRSISESRHNAIGKALQHLANGGNPNCEKILAMLVWS